MIDHIKTYLPFASDYGPTSSKIPAKGENRKKIEYFEQEKNKS